MQNKSNISKSDSQKAGYNKVWAISSQSIFSLLILLMAAELVLWAFVLMAVAWTQHLGGGNDHLAWSHPSCATAEWMLDSTEILP